MVKLSLAFIIVIAGCTTKSVYENIQLNNRQQCYKLPPSQYDECMANANKSYDDYQRQRNETLEGK